MRIYVDQRAISRNSSADSQEPVFVVEREDGTRTLAHGVAITGPSLLRYDRTRQPRAWLETADAEPLSEI